MEVEAPAPYPDAGPSQMPEPAPAQEFEVINGFTFPKDPNAPPSSTHSTPQKPTGAPSGQKSSATEKTASKVKKSNRSKSTGKKKLQKAPGGAKAEVLMPAQGDAGAPKPKKKSSNKSKTAKPDEKGSKKTSSSKKKSKTVTLAADVQDRATASPEVESMQHDYYEPTPVGHAYDPDADTDQEDDRLWCVCQEKYQYGKLMICCDGCDDWFHPRCLKMEEDDVELVNSFFCPKCEKATGRRTTWFARCSRHGCNNAQLALSKFCSDYCGMSVAATKLAKVGYDPMDLWSIVKDAQKRQGFVLLHDTNAPEQTEENFKMPLFSSSTPPSAQTRTKMQLENSPSKVQLRTALPTFDDDKEELAAERKSQTLRTALQENKSQQAAIQKQIDLLEARYKLYHIAFDKWQTSTEQSLESDGHAETTSKSKKGKGSGSTATKANDAPCGLDERLTWDDKPWAEWAESEAGQLKLRGEDTPEVRESERGLVCTIPRKRCDRHQGWQKVQDSALDLGLSLQKRKAGKIQQAERDLAAQLQEHLALQESLRYQRQIKAPGGMPLPPVNILNGIPL